MLNPLKKIFYIAVEREFKGSKTVLDVGCGRFSMLARLSGDYDSTGLDAFAPALEESKAQGIHKKYVLGDIMEVDFPAKSFDVVLCCQVIEHLTPEDGEALLKKMERWAKEKIVITVPNSQYGFVETHDHEAVNEGFDRYGAANFMRHRSGWTTDALVAHGFQKVRGFQGFEKLDGKKGRGWRALYYLSYLFTYFMPRQAHQLLAIKSV